MCLIAQFSASQNYVDLSIYKNQVYQEPKEGIIEKLFKSGWQSFTSSINESIYSDNISSDNFWNMLHKSMEQGTFYNRLANSQIIDSQTGGDLFLSAVYSSIEQVPVTYRSTLPNGDSVTLSGKIFLPKNHVAKHIIIANHYTICSNKEAPSNANSIEGIYATKGYIVLMPDYIGYGITDSLIHPYLHLASSVSAAVDLLKSAIPYLKARSYTFYNSIILLGYSQGAAVTLALQKTLEEQYAYQYPLSKVFAGAGPYDLSATFDYYTEKVTTDIPCSLPMLILGMNYGENLGLHSEDFFQPSLMEKCPVYIESKSKVFYEVNSALGNNISYLIKPIIFRKDSFPTSVLYEAVRKNNIINWTPKTTLFLFHSKEDNMVPFFNSEHLKAAFDEQDLDEDDIEYDFGNYGNHMNAAITFFEKVYKSL